MGRKPNKKKSTKAPGRVPCYKLSEAKRLVKADKFVVTGKALRTAFESFGWSKPEIKRFYLSLRGHHFYKKERADKWDTDYLDVYTAEMYGCRVYTHFFINEKGEVVIVNSFKQDTSGAKK